MNAEDIQAVRMVLKQFQDGYTHRDTTLIDDFRTLFIPEDELEVLGTAGIDPGDDEWCLGPDAACELFQNDWLGWGDLKLDIADARIHSLGDVAWLATTGIVEMDLDPEETYRDYLSYIGEMVAGEEDTPPRERLLELLRGGTNTLFETERGKDYIWPLRFTAVLVRRSGRWLFHQIQFSFATTHLPDVRYFK